MTRTQTTTTQLAPGERKPPGITRQQGTAIVVCLVAILSGLGLFALRAEQERRGVQAKERSACMAEALQSGRITEYADLKASC